FGAGFGFGLAFRFAAGSISAAASDAEGSDSGSISSYEGSGASLWPESKSSGDRVKSSKSSSLLILFSLCGKAAQTTLGLVSGTHNNPSVKGFNNFDERMLRPPHFLPRLQSKSQRN